MGVTRLLLLRPFYYIQTNFLYFFAHDCNRFKLQLNSPHGDGRDGHDGLHGGFDGGFHGFGGVGFVVD